MSNIRLTSNFSPTQISGCQLWLDAADPTVITTSGTTVTGVTDKSGTNKAITITNTVSYIPKESLVFTNTTGVLTISGMPLAPYDILTVVSPNSSTSSFRTLLRTISNTGTHPLLLNSANNNLGMWDSTAFRQFGSLTLGPNEKGLIYATMASGRTMQASKNGLESLTASTLAGNESSIRFIGNNSTGGQPWGSLHELLIFNTTLSLGTRQILEGYLAWKWGLRSALPDSHPYYNYPVYSLNMPNVVFPLYSYKTPLFQPTFFPNCTLWLDSADQSSLTMNDNLVVTQWRDKSGLANHASNVGTIRLTSQIGGLPTMTYPGTASTYFIGPVVNSGSTLTAFSVFLMNTSSYVVARILSLARIGSFDYNSTLFTAAIQRNGGTFMGFRNLTNLGSITGTFGSPVQVASLYTGSNHTIFMNGVAGTTVNTSGNFGYSNYEVGSSFGEENLVPLNGTIGEVIHFNRALTTEQRQQIEGYLATKWGLQGSLGATHPYKSVAFGALPPFPLVPVIPKAARNDSFSPLSVGNLSGWYDAADLRTLTLIGSAIVSMADKSGNGRTASGSTVRPTLTLASLNRKSVISFGGVNQFFTTSLTVPSNSHCLVAVHRPTTLIANNSLFRFQVSSYIVFPYYNTRPLGYITSFDGADLNFQNSQMLENSVTTSFQIIMANIRSGEQRVYRNGILQSSESEPLTAGTSDFLDIGALSQLNEFYNGNLAEMLVFSVFLDDSKRNQIEGYLAWKWGLVGDLPQTHPFKLFPPSP